VRCVGRCGLFEFCFNEDAHCRWSGPILLREFRGRSRVLTCRTAPRGRDSISGTNGNAAHASSSMFHSQITAIPRTEIARAPEVAAAVPRRVLKIEIRHLICARLRVCCHEGLSVVLRVDVAIPLHFGKYSSVRARRKACFAFVERQHEALSAAREETRSSDRPRILSMIPSKARAIGNGCTPIRRRRVWMARQASGATCRGYEITIRIAWTQLAGAGIAGANFRRELAGRATCTRGGTKGRRVFSRYAMIAPRIPKTRELACLTKDAGFARVCSTLG
jgi:hypothetical protein